MQKIKTISLKTFQVLALLGLIIGQQLVFGLKANALTTAPILISAASDGSYSNDDSSLQIAPQISSDGRYVAFRSLATNINSGDSTSAGSELNVKDLQTNQYQNSATTATGDAFNRSVQSSYLAGDGRHVAIVTNAYNIDPTAPGGPGVGVYSIYVKNLNTGAIPRASKDIFGNTINGVGVRPYVSDDGNIVAMTGQTGTTGFLYVKNMTTGDLWTADNNASLLGLSGNGQYLLYSRGGTLYRVDLTNRVPIPVMTVTGSILSAQIANDGRIIFNSPTAYVSGATDNCWNGGFCNRLYTIDPSTNAISLVDTRQDGTIPQQYAGSARAYMSANGNVITWMTQSIMRSDKTYYPSGNGEIYSRNLTTGAINLVSVNAGSVPSDSSQQENGWLTADGSQAVMQTNTTNFGTPANCQPYGPALVADMRQCHDVYLISTSADDIVDASAPTLTSNDIDPTSAQFFPTFSDSGSGISGGEFWVDSADPGLGNGTRMDNSGVQPLQLHADFQQFAQTPGTYNVHFRAYDKVGNWSQTYSFTYTITGDTVPPTIGAFSWTGNPKPLTGTATLTVPVSDDNTGVSHGEYFVGDTDPGQGNGTAMGFDGSNLSANFGTNFTTGVYKISVRAVDNTGNWSALVSDYLVVYDANGPKMTGKKTIVPSLGNNDVLPGLIASNQTDKATFGFSVKYNNQGQINANSDLQFTYATGTHCNGKNASNCHTTSLNATSIAWLTTQGTNNSTGIFQGTGSLVIDGRSSTVLFRVTGVDGTRLSPTANDQFAIQIYDQNANPTIDTPLYAINSATITRGNIKIQ